MLKMLTNYIFIFVAPLIFHKSAEAFESQDKDRVYLTYNLVTDPCFKVSIYSVLEAKEAADSACKDAFLALDRVEGNSCNGWRRPGCRQLHLPDYDYYQCSCRIPSCNEYEINSNGAIAFHDCAWKLNAEELLWGIKTLSPSADSQSNYQQIHDHAMQKASLRHEVQTSFEPGTSVKPVKTRVRTPGPFVCSVCGRKYATKMILNYHAVSHMKDIRCIYCHRPFTNQGNLNAHMKLHYKKPSEIESAKALKHSTKRKIKEVYDHPYLCEFCGKSYQGKAALRAHKKVHTEEVRCSLCKIDFASKGSYRTHMRSHHPEIAQEDKEKAKFVEEMEKHFECGTCGARFTTSKSLHLHGAVHRGETRCELCDKTFPRKTMLNKHKRKDHP